jgi:hypothetical protein
MRISHDLSQLNRASVQVVVLLSSLLPLAVPQLLYSESSCLYGVFAPAAATISRPRAWPCA